ncbi:hypothetical protein BV20DRAFT_968630 [Pilatotrama ljubarskyi]|nr:hypothetical protein BV20DRAFT_968630 [Pilatotrama ljubarskyi]
MRLLLVSCWCAAALVDVSLAAALGDSAKSADIGERGLNGIFDGLHGQDQTTTHERTLTGNYAAQTTVPLPDDSELKPFLGFPSASEPSSTRSKDKAQETTAGPTGTSYSVIGTLPPIHMPSAPYSNTIPVATSTSSANSLPPTAAAAATGSSASSGTSEWKIIGVAVIAFTTVAGILLLSVFFDQWWRFIRDLVWRRRKKATEEELVPDWEKAEWHLRLQQDRQRYPSFTSLPSVATVQPPPAAAAGPSRTAGDKTLGRHLGTSADLAGNTPETGCDMGPDRIGLGLGRVWSVRREVSSPNRGTAGRSPAPGGCAGKNPFDDPHSPTPEDVYGGVEN